MDSRHDFTLEKVFWGYFGALDQKANSALKTAEGPISHFPRAAQRVLDKYGMSSGELFGHVFVACIDKNPTKNTGGVLLVRLAAAVAGGGWPTRSK